MKPNPSRRSWFAPFRDAGRGLATGLTTERHLKIHATATVLVAVAAVGLRVSPTEGAILCLVVGSVWTAELLNSAVETLCNRVTLEQDPLIGRAKDLAAAAVLVASLAAAGVGALVFLPRLVALVRNPP